MYREMLVSQYFAKQTWKFTAVDCKITYHKV